MLTWQDAAPGSFSLSGFDLTLLFFGKVAGCIQKCPQQIHQRAQLMFFQSCACEMLAAFEESAASFIGGSSELQCGPLGEYLLCQVTAFWRQRGEILLL